MAPGQQTVKPDADLGAQGFLLRLWTTSTKNLVRIIGEPIRTQSTTRGEGQTGQNAQHAGVAGEVGLLAWGSARRTYFHITEPTRERPRNI